jgi:hypothetical protein
MLLSLYTTLQGIIGHTFSYFTSKKGGTFASDDTSPLLHLSQPSWIHATVTDRVALPNSSPLSH